MTTLLNDYKRKKKYVYSGSWDGVKDQYGDGPEGFSSGMQDGAGELTYSTANSGDAPTGEQGTTGGNSTAMGASIVDAGIQLGSAAIIAQTNKQKNQKTGWTPDGHYRTKSGAQGIATGWSIGNKIYPGIGGIVGAFAGGIYGAFRGNKQDKEAKKEWEGNNALFRQKEQLAMQGQAYNQWSKQQGNPQTQMYRYGGKMRKSPYRVDKSLKPTSFDNMSTTEYLEPNTIPPDPIEFTKTFGKIGLETILDQSDFGKGINTTNTARELIANRNAGNAVNLGLEAIKFGTGPTGDFGSNLAQELITEAQNSKYQRVGLPGAASQAEEYQKLPPIKSVAKHPRVPSSSTTAVRKPLVQKANGGSLRKTSSNSTEVHGPSHANGGVKVPQANAELEGGETILHESDQDYVFSKELGFAELHKKLAKSRGKIENKPATFERLNSLRAISEKEQMLKQAQENIRSQYNLK